MSAQTMLEIAGANPPVGTPKTAALIVIDAQEEYRDGECKVKREAKYDEFKEEIKCR